MLRFSKYLMWLVGLLTTYIVISKVVTDWSSIQTSLRHITVLHIISALFLTELSVLISGYVFHLLLYSISGEKSIPTTLPIFLIGQLGKYVPGSLWFMLLQIELGKKAKIPRSATFIASLQLLGLGIVTGAILGMPLAFQYMHQKSEATIFIVIALCGAPFLNARLLNSAINFALKLIKKSEVQSKIQQSTLNKSVFFLCVSWIALSTQLIFLLPEFGLHSATDISLIVGTMSLAMIAGQLAFFLPSGLGVREFILARSLSNYVTGSQVAAVIVSSRILFLISDLMLGLGSLAFTKRDRSSR